MSRKVRIYALMDPISNEIRYVGYTVHEIEQRLAGHIRKAMVNPNTHCLRWIRKLHPNRPIVVLIDEVNEEDADGAERYWIRYFRELGCPMTNITDGGKGALSVIQSKETIEKRVSQFRGKTRPTEVGIAISKAKQKNPFVYTDDIRAKMSNAKRGKPWSKAQKEAFDAIRGDKFEINDQTYCVKCRSGPYRGIRGIYRHYWNSHQIKLSGGYNSTDSITKIPVPENNRLVSCVICRKILKSAPGLKRHVRQTHG